MREILCCHWRAMLAPAVVMLSGSDARGWMPLVAYDPFIERSCFLLIDAN
jgi:hypothetical protein